MTKEQIEFYFAQVGSPLQIAIKDNEPLQKQIVEMIDACKKMVVAEERKRVVEILENNRGETKWGDANSNEVMKESINNYIIAVKDDLSSLDKLTDKE